MSPGLSFRSISRKFRKLVEKLPSMGMKQHSEEIGGTYREFNVGSVWGISHLGGRDNNEDNLLVLKLSNAYLLAVADGLGGHNAGEVASQMAVDTLRKSSSGSTGRKWVMRRSRTSLTKPMNWPTKG